MAEVTKRQLAEQIGCTKQTVTKAMQGLDLDGHVVRRGQTDYFDEYAASAIADVLAPRFAKPTDLGSKDVLLELLDHYKVALADSEAMRRADAERHAEELERYRSMLSGLEGELDDRAAMLADERALNSELGAKLASAREALAEIKAAPFWKRHAIAARALLPSPGESD